MLGIALLERGNWEAPFCPVPFGCLKDILGFFEVIQGIPPVLALSSADGLLKNLTGLLPVFL